MNANLLLAKLDERGSLLLFAYTSCLCLVYVLFTLYLALGFVEEWHKDFEVPVVVEAWSLVPLYPVPFLWLTLLVHCVRDHIRRRRRMQGVYISIVLTDREKWHLFLLFVLGLPPLVLSVVVTLEKLNLLFFT